MIAPSPLQKRLANALLSLKALQDAGQVVVRSSDLKRQERETLVSQGFLRLVVQGWYLPCRPGEMDGDSTSWYAAAQDFVAGYGESRFGADWCLSPDYSVRLHAGNTLMPRQVVIHAPAANNSLLALPWDHSILSYQAKDFPHGKTLQIGRLRVMTLAHALVRVPESFFRTHARDAQIAMGVLHDADELIRELLEGGHSVVAGRLAGALRAAGRSELADDVLATMRQVGYTVIESDPFAQPLPQLSSARGESPYAMRIRLMWQDMREAVIAAFPAGRGLPSDASRYLASMDDAYQSDAYHSLSIEGYRVTDELIQRVARGDWDPGEHKEDADARNALAAHGYWLAHTAVKDSIRRILAGDNAGEVVRKDHRHWFRQLFSPSVSAGILSADKLAGYRGHQVYIRHAEHVPPAKEAVRDMMPVLFDLLEAEPEARVRAVLGHFVFVFIHPYMDGNGRMGRFLMNAMLASGGYAWMVVRVERRSEYMAALNDASARGDISPFARFLASSLDGLAPTA